ncbi:hypothetical protein K2173_004473 [Erythroxylum novogranatense]|uniref:PHD-type domain-containing protein n=1 Tax=Erythroxylum novogranatense TaxID=1862640 RepID=A0AAV8T4K5_9ROSI|nr:hypothetical protein K2173_004473 [Erythroxylum novogranatense]
MIPSQTEKRLVKHSMKRKIHSGAESGTCNVCSAPCSSCMHRKQACMGSKGDECSDETWHATATSQNSVNEDGGSPCQDGTCDNLQHTPSEASNMLSFNANHDSLSENSESKATVRSSDIADASANSEKLPKLSSIATVAESQLLLKPLHLSDQKISVAKHEDAEYLEGQNTNFQGDRKASIVGIAKLDPLEMGDVSAVSSVLKVQNLGGLSPHVKSESTMEYSNLSLTKGKGSCIGSNNCSAALESSEKCGRSPAREPNKVHPKTQAEINSTDQTDEGPRCFNKIEQNETLDKPAVKFPDILETPFQSVSGDESDDSEIVEHDVKVCDICGDAGREEQLAICSRCSDGAEHIYCMREMLRKLPEGDWLCEECKLTEETDNQKLDAEGIKTDKALSRSSGKRCAVAAEVKFCSKRQAIETSSGSPKPSSPSRIAALSRDTSFKNLEKVKVKHSHYTSSGNQLSTDSSEIARSCSTNARLQPPKGTLLKSNSFNALSSKPKVKLVDEVPSKHKGMGESSSLDVKEEPVRMISKSTSFKSVNSSRLNAAETKVKMLSPKFSHNQDVQGPRQKRNAFERKNLSKLDRPLVSSVIRSSVVATPKADSKTTNRGESAVSSSSNNREIKPVQSDVKMGSLLRSTSCISRKGADVLVSSARASPSVAGCGASAEQKLNHVASKDEPSSSSSWTSDRPSNNGIENLQDCLDRPCEALNQGEKTREGAVNLLKSTETTGQKNIICQKCKERGHTTENCTIIIPQDIDADISTARNFKVEMGKGNKLKAAIEAAMLKKPGIYGKRKGSEQSDVFSSSNFDLSCDTTSYDQFSKVKSMISNDRIIEGQMNYGTCSSGFYKKNCNSDKQLNLQLGDVIPSVATSNHSSAGNFVLGKMSSIPEDEYIWQGTFDVYKGGKSVDVYGGIQAHLSTSASPKIPAVVNKFSHKISFEEVSRLSTWPTQFHDNGAKEENIALYFFAKDLGCYEKSYKGLLEKMIKNDLALKGSFDGVELLIFPSTQLPESSQRWNMLHFMWGVFRGKRSNCSESLKKAAVTSLNAPPASLPLHENSLSLKHTDQEMSVCDGAHNVTLASSVTPDKTCVPLEVNDNKLSSFYTHLKKQDTRIDPKSISRVMRSSPLCQENRYTCPAKEEMTLQECRLETNVKASSTSGGSGTSNGGQETQVLGDASCARGSISSFDSFQATDKNLHVGGCDHEEEMMDINNTDRDKCKDEAELNESNVNMDFEAPMDRDSTIKRLNSWLSNRKKRPYLDLSKTAHQTSDRTSKKIPWSKVDGKFTDREISSKKAKTDVQYPDLTDENHPHGSFDSQLCNLSSSSSVEEKIHVKTSDEEVILEGFEAAERYFFPVDSHHVDDFWVGGKSMSQKEYSSKDGARAHDGTPNLELALGADTKSPNKGILPFFVGMVEENNNLNKPPEKVEDKEEEDGVSASLSLSLSFPFPEKEKSVKPVPKTELIPESHCVNTSLLLFGSYSDK